MAKYMNRGNNKLEAKAGSNLILSLVLIVVGFFAFFTADLMGMRLLGMLTALFGGYLHNKGRGYSSGAKGEKTARKLLEKLPEDYTVIGDLTIEAEGKSSQIDHLIVGPTGLFVVESKNHNGRITGSENDQNLIQHKIGRKGGRYTSNLYNPIKQVNTHVYRTAKYLQSRGLNYWINGAVLFTNHDVVLDVSFEKTPIYAMYDYGDSLLEYIVGYKPRKLLTKKEVDAIVDAICGEEQMKEDRQYRNIG